MTVVAKFYCAEVTEHGYPAHPKQAETVKLSPVSGKENEPWASATPSGELRMYIANKSAFGAFKVGKVYELALREWPEEPAKVQG